MRTLLPLILLAGAASACAPSTLEAPLVPNPVLLGPVDRVGGHRAGQERTVRVIEGEVSDFASSNKTAGVTTTTVMHAGAGPIAQQFIEATEGRPERDVRVDQIPAGAYAMVGEGAAVLNQWVGVKARVVEVSRGR